MPTVSVIIPNYNHAAYLKQRIDSVIDQTYQDFEVIILDDCSKDDSKNVIEQYRNHPRVSHIVYNEENSGSTFMQWKKGVELAKGEWIWIAESDDWAELTFLEKLLKLGREDSAIGLLYCSSYSAEETGNVSNINNWAERVDPKHWEKDFVNSGSDEIKNYLFSRNTIPNASAILIKKQIIQKVLKENDKTFKYAGDWYFWIKSLENCNIGFVKEPLNYFRQHSNTTRVAKSVDKEILRFKEYFFVIDYIIKKYRINLDFKKHSWIIYEWIGKKEIFKANKRLFYFPPFPLLYYYHFYKILLASKLKS